MQRSITVALALSLGLVACDDAPTTPQKAPSRFDSVKAGGQSKKAEESFCEVRYPASGPDARAWKRPASRPVPKKPAAAETDAAKPGAGWTWVNLWASWCQPCIAELPLLGRWQKTLEKEGLPVRFEMWSVDSAADDLAGVMHLPFPGDVHWIASDDELPKLLDHLGVDKSSAIPIHALVDPAGNLRCVRVGSVGEELYGTVKAIIAQR